MTPTDQTWTCRTQESVSVFEAIETYQQRNERDRRARTAAAHLVPLPKGLLAGVRVVLAESFERIHRSNLVNMGIIPVTFLKVNR